MPGLQREGCRQCVCCGREADGYCARCGLTPYCSTHCQRRDWADRHRAVCHNLARLPHNKIVPELPNLPQASPLRRPHSPAPRVQTEKDVKNDDSESETANKNHRQGAKNNGSAGNRFNHRNLSSFVKRQPARQNKDNQDGEAKHNQQQQPEKPLPQQQQPQHQQPQKQQPEPHPAANNNDSEKAKNTQTMAQLRRPKAVNNAPEVAKEEPKPITPKVQIQEPPKVKQSPPVKDEPKLVPKTYMIEHLSVGESVLLSVDQRASACRTNKPGYVCLAMHDKYEADYQKLCEDYVLDCEANNKPYTMSPGESLSYLNPEDGGWYRGRCVANNTIALLDASKLVQLKPDDKCRHLPDNYQHIPEFSCLLNSKDVEVGANIKCTLVSKTADGFKVTIYDVDSDAELGSGEVMRWIPDVEYPVKPTVAATPAAKPAPKLPEAVRPALRAGGRYVVCDCAGARLCVRPADDAAQATFHAVMEDVAIYGASATPLRAPPSAGSVVVAQYTDGLHYRALVQRTSVNSNRYMIQYLEYGNVEVTQLERLYECPAQHDASTIPAVTSILTLDVPTPLTTAAETYLEQLKEQEVVLTLADGADAAPSGSVANLTVVASKEDVSSKLRDLCTPHWKSIEQRGGDVLETPAVLYEQLSCSELPARGVLRVLDASLLDDATLCVCVADHPHHSLVANQLAAWMAEYCNSALGREPYLPKTTEMCIAYYEPEQQWCRAALLEQLGGPGGDSARLLFVDSGRVEVVPVKLIRKMLPEFVNGLPAVATHLEIKDFPKQPTQEMLSRARQFLKIDERGRGEIAVTNCVKLDDGLYRGEAPQLLRAIGLA